MWLIIGLMDSSIIPLVSPLLTTAGNVFNVPVTVVDISYLHLIFIPANGSYYQYRDGAI